MATYHSMNLIGGELTIDHGDTVPHFTVYPISTPAGAAAAAELGQIPAPDGF